MTVQPFSPLPGPAVPAASEAPPARHRTRAGPIPPLIPPPSRRVAAAAAPTGWRHPSAWLAAALVLCGVLLYWLPPEQHNIYPRCLMHSLTGLQCPGCGGLRAGHELLHGRVSAAFQLNPVAVLLAALLPFYAAGRALSAWTGRDWLRPFRAPFWLWLMLALLLVFTLLRNIR